MKKLIIVIIIVIVLAVMWYLISPLWRVVELDDALPSGGMETNGSGTIVQPVPNDGLTHVPPAIALVAQGDFVPSAHDVAGRALVIDNGTGKRTLRFEDFETVNGPDLFIYLSADLEAKDFVNLGSIRATKGNVNYEIPTGTDTEKYNKVLVWCRAFRVLFSYSELK